MRISDWSSDVCSSDLFKEPTFRVALEHHFSRDILAYVSFNTGFKSGGYALLSADAYDPEKLKAYEAGLKTEWFNRTLRPHLNGFLYRYPAQQVNVYRKSVV